MALKELLASDDADDLRTEMRLFLYERSRCPSVFFLCTHEITYLQAVSISARQEPETRNRGEMAEELRNELKRVKAKREHLEAENELLKAITRSSPSSNPGEQCNSNESRLLTSEEKLELANSQISSLKSSSNAHTQPLRERVDHLHALIEEARSLEQDAQHDLHALRHSVQPDRSPSTSRVLQFVDSVSRSKKQQLEKLKLRCFTLKSKVKKQEAQLSHKDQHSDVPSQIDYEQLKIENQQAHERIEERKFQILNSKDATGKSVQQLMDKKRKLNEMVQTGEQLQSEKERKERDLAHYDSKIERMKEECERLKRKLSLVKREHEDVDKPRVIDYIRLQSEREESEHKLAKPQRKAHITTSTGRLTSNSQRLTR